MLTIGGVPLIYLGDEIGTMNDYAYRHDPAKAKDSRWVHRPAADQTRYARRNQPETLEGQVYSGFKQLIAIRKNNPVFTGQDTLMIDTGDEHVLGYIRHHQGEQVIVLANFSEEVCVLSANLLRVYGQGAGFTNLLKDEQMEKDDIELGPYQFTILKMSELIMISNRS